MNILVIGAGSIGCLVGAKLLLSGHDVTLVGRPRFASAVSKNGLQLRDERGQHEVVGARTATSIMQAFDDGTIYNFAVLTVKSYDTASAADELGETPAADNGFTVISLQNGVGNEEALAAKLGPASVIAGTITTPVSTIGPGNVQVQKPDYSVGLSPWHPAVSSTAFEAASTCLSDSGFNVTHYPDAQGMKWTKLLLNMVGNASCAILDASPDAVFADKSMANLEITAWRETLRVMRAAQIPPINIGSYPFSFLAPLIRTAPRPLLRQALNRSVGKARGGKMPSLHIDLEMGRPRSEVGWLNGATVRKGSEMKVRTPVNRMLTDVLLQLVEEPSNRDKWRRNPKRLAAAADAYRKAE